MKKEKMTKEILTKGESMKENKNTTTNMEKRLENGNFQGLRIEIQCQLDFLQPWELKPL